MNIILKAKTFIFKQKIYSSISFKILFFLFFLQMGIALKGIAQTTYTSIAGAGNWNQTTTWVGGVVPVTNPSAGNKVIINGTVTITTPLGFQDLDITVNKSLTVGAGGDITISRLITISNLGALVINSGRTLTVDYEGRIINNGTININGTITRGTNFEPLNTFPIWGYAPGPWPLNNNTTGIVNINNGGTLQWTNAPTSLGFDANINNAGTINVSGTLNNANVAANKLINNGVLQLNQGGTLAATPTYGGSSTLIYNQTANVNVGNEWTGNSTTVGVGVPQNIIVQINAATLTMPAARGLAGNLTISSGTLALAATLTNKANTITNNAILQLNQGGIIGTAPVIYGNASTLIYNQTAVTTIGNEWSANSTVTTAGSGIPQDVIIQLNAKATTVTIPNAVNKSIGGNLNINTGTFILAGTSNFYLGGDWINNSAFSAGGGSSVNFQGTNDNILAGSSSTTFNDLVVNKSVGKKVTSNSLAFSTARNVIVTQGNLILQAIDANYVVNNDILVATNGVLTHSVPWDSPPLKLDKLLLVSGNISIDGVFNYTVRSHVQMNGIGKTVYTGNKAGSAFSIFTLTSPGNISAAGTVNINDNFWPMFGTAGSFSTGTNTVNANASVLMNNGSVNINGGTFNVIGGISIGFSGNPAIVNLSAGTLNADLVNVGNGPVKGTFNHSGGVANIGNLIITNTTPTSAYICTGSPVINMTGNWTNNGIFTAASSQVNFLGTTLQSISGATTFYNLAKSNNSTLMLNSNVTVSNNLVFNSVNDLLDINGQTLTIAKTLSSINQFKGSFASNMTIGAGSPALNFITGSQNLNNLILSGVSSLGTPLTINNNLNLNTSLFTIGNNDLSFIPSATITGSTGPTNMIIATGPGKVVKQFSGVGSFTYPIGDATGTTEYSPATISFTSGTFGPNANVGVNVVNDKQPYNTSASDFVNRYWNVSTNNITNYSANPVFTYVSADMVGVLANIKTAGFGVDSVWSIGNPATATTLSVTGETNLNKSYTGVNFTAANVYFRSITNGLWSNGANWQSSISGNSFWSTTLIVPNSTSLGILIKGGDTVSVNSSISLGKTLVNGDLKLVTGGIMTLANAPDALTVNTGAIFNVTTTGNYTTTFLTSPNSNITVNTGGKILVGDGVTATGADFEYLADITHKSVWRTGAIFEWNINRVPRTLTFFPTASSDIPIFRISKTSNQPMGITAVNGILEVNTPVNLSTPTNTILRNGIISNNRSILTQSSTGAFQITADNAVLNNMKLDLNGGGLNIQGNTISSDSVNITGTQNITVSAGKTLSVNGVFDVSDRNISGPGGMTLNGTSVYRTGNPGGFSGAGSSLTTTTSLLKPGATVELYATGNQTLNSRNDFTNIIFSGSGTKSLAGIDFAPAGTVTMMNNIVVNSGTTNMGGPSSNLTMIGGSRFIVNNSGLQPTFGGTYNIALNGAPNFIEFNGAAGQTIRGNGVTYNRLEVSGAGVSNAGQNISLGVNGIFLINNGGIYNSVNNTITGSGVGTSADHWAVAVANGGTFLVGNPGGFNGTLNTSAVDNNKIDIIGLQAGSTVNYNGTNQVITIPTTTDYSNLVLSGTGNKTAPSDSLSIKGDFTKSGSAIFINNGGKIAFNGIAGQTFYSTGTRQLVFNNFANNNTAGLTINDSMAIYKEMYLGLNSKLILKDSVTLKSDNLNTANVPPIQHDNAIAYSSKGTTSGSFIVERYMPVNKKAWHILSRPTKGSTIKASWQEGSLIPNGNPKPGFGINITSNGPTPLDRGFDAASTLPSVKTYTANNYVGIPNTTGNADGLQAYYVFVRGDRSVTTATTGGPTILRTMGKIYNPGTEAPLPIAINQDEFAMIGNPYPSEIKFDQIVTRTNLKQFYYVWDPKLTGDFGTGAFRTISADGLIQVPLDPTGPAYPILIESGQGFFVQASTGGGSIGFDENAKVAGSNNRVFSFAKQAVDQPMAKIRGNIYSSTTGTRVLLDGVLTLFSGEYTNSLNLDDGEKLDIPSESMGISRGGEIIAIGRREMPTINDTIFYDLKQLKYSNYELQLIADNMESTGMNAYLKDKYLGTDQKLNPGINTINIQIENIAGSKAADRFYVYFKPASTLPVSLLNLTAVEKNGDVIVTWKVENEKDMLEYTVEVSADGNQFSKGGTVSSRNVNSGVYQWTDVSVSNGYHYYRLKITGKDGKVNYSSIVKVLVGNIEGKPSIAIYPNPIVNNEIRVQLENLPSGIYKARLLNNAGQFVQAMELNHAGGNSIELLQVGNKLAAGVYHLEISKNGEKVFAGKVVVP